MRASISSNGVGHEVSVDGKDVTRGVSSTTVYLDPGVATATIEVALPVVQFVGIAAEVVVSEEARELLIAAGWTAPSDG